MRIAVLVLTIVMAFLSCLCIARRQVFIFSDAPETVNNNNWNDLKAQVAQGIANYQYTVSLNLLEDLPPYIKAENIRNEIEAYLDDVKGEQILFNNMLKDLTAGPARKKIVVNDREIWITTVDENGFQGALVGVSGSVYSRRWSDVPAQSILALFPKNLNKTERFNLATFCYHHSLEGEGEQILINLLQNYPDLKSRIDRFLASYKGIDLPEGGYAVYQRQLVTVEEKSFLEKGYVKYKNQWMSYDEMMTQKGFIKFQDRWMTPEEKEKIETQLNTLAALQRRLAPKGVIDKPGADKEKLSWEKALTKETEHYVIKTNLSKEALDDICYLMECLYFEHKKTFKVTNAPGGKLTVYVFRESKEYYSNGGHGGGVFMAGRGTQQIMTFYQPPRTSSVLLHEGTHQFVHLVCRTNVPIWINEGLATYYESSIFEGTSLKTNIVNRERLQLIKSLIVKKDVPRLEDVINIRQANFSIYEYAHTWSLVYFFMNYNKGQYADELEDYFEAIKKKGFENRPLHKKLFEESFKVKFEVLEKQWEEYIIKL